MDDMIKGIIKVLVTAFILGGIALTTSVAVNRVEIVNLKELQRRNYKMLEFVYKRLGGKLTTLEK